MINSSGANVLAVGVGSPKQELWIVKYKDLMPNIKIFLAIGASIDFESGLLTRAPKLLTRMGLEWCYRIYQEPARLWKRYLLDDLPVIKYLFLHKIGLYQNPWSSVKNRIKSSKSLATHE
jgi:exopolysaccharide biosynthesis WecB/TagA/CpsF family protein